MPGQVIRSKAGAHASGGAAATVAVTGRRRVKRRSCDQRQSNLCVRFERIPIDLKDAAGADLAASGWLRAAGADPARYPGAEPASAAWIGSRSTLEALGVEREGEVSLDRVASIIETVMRQIRSAEQQERAEPASQPAHPASPEPGLPALAWSLPRSVSELRLAPEPETDSA